MGHLGSKSNYGFGAKMAYAGFNALRENYQGHFATVHSHAGRFNEFAAWAKENGVRNAEGVSPDTLRTYGEYLAEKVSLGEMKVSYAQNLLSSCNVTLSALRGDDSVRVSPSELVGQRSQIRTEAPAGLDRDAVGRAADSLRAAGHDRAAAVVELARDLGLRMREAALIDARAALLQARTTGAVSITEGTKGGRGREIARTVPASDRAIATLERAAIAQGSDRNLVPAADRWIDFRSHLHSVAIPALERQGLKGLHDLRAAFACERYQQLTGHAAPCVAGEREASRGEDRAARAEISQELGHGRADVLGAYVGSSR